MSDWKNFNIIYANGSSVTAGGGLEWTQIREQYKEKYNLDECILNCEPLVCNAKYDWHYNQKEFNEHVNTIINKDLYFIHFYILSMSISYLQFPLISQL